jgi:putative NADPH-quinone reductase
MKKILIILGHPNKHSLDGSLAKAYADAAHKAGHHTKQLNVGDLKFSPNLPDGYTSMPELESDLIEAQKDIKWADHLVFIFPMWWFSVPALLKGFFDRVFVPGFGFNPGKHGLPAAKLLKGKSARIIVTSGGPPLYYILCGDSAVKTVKRSLQYCGVGPVKPLHIGPVLKPTEEQVEKWMNKIKKLAKNGI